MLLVEKELSGRFEHKPLLKLSRNHMEFAGLIVYFSVIGFCLAFVLVLMLAAQ